jgi:hypothetical protein
MQAQGITVETETVRSARLARLARAAFEAGRATGFELATVVEDGHDAFLLDLADDAPYGTQAGQPTAADWDWYLNR